jgi:TetR/AcrR family transcriptional repressor of mexJK operon
LSEIALKPRGRPKSEEKQRQIFEAAVELFTLHGYEGTSMDKVAEAASVSKQTVYSHFNNKRQLFNAAIEQLADTLGLGADLAHDERPIAEALTEIGNRFLALLVSPEAIRLYRLVVGSAAQHPELGKRLYETGPRTFIDRLAGLLEQRARAGELDVPEPRLAAAQFFSMMRGELHMRVALGVQHRITREELAHYVARCVETFVRGHGGEM